MARCHRCRAATPQSPPPRPRPNPTGQKTSGSPLGSIVRAVARFFARLTDPVHVAALVDDLIFIMSTPEHMECACFEGGCQICAEYHRASGAVQGPCVTAASGGTASSAGCAPVPRRRGAGHASLRGLAAVHAVGQRSIFARRSLLLPIQRGPGPGGGSIWPAPSHREKSGSQLRGRNDHNPLPGGGHGSSGGLIGRCRRPQSGGTGPGRVRTGLACCAVEVVPSSSESRAPPAFLPRLAREGGPRARHRGQLACSVLARVVLPEPVRSFVRSCHMLLCLQWGQVGVLTVRAAPRQAGGPTGGTDSDGALTDSGAMGN